MKQNRPHLEIVARTLFLEPRYRRLKLAAVIRGVLPSARSGNGILDVVREKELLSAWDIIRQGEMMERQGQHNLSLLPVLKNKQEAIAKANSLTQKGQKLQELDAQNLAEERATIDRERLVALHNLLSKSGFLK